MYTEDEPCLVLIACQSWNCCCRRDWPRHRCNRLRCPTRHSQPPSACCNLRGRSAAAACRRHPGARMGPSAASQRRSRPDSEAAAAAGWCMWQRACSVTDAAAADDDDDCDGRTPSSGCLECGTRRVEVIWASRHPSRRHQAGRPAGTAAGGAARPHTTVVC